MILCKVCKEKREIGEVEVRMVKRIGDNELVGWVCEDEKCQDQVSRNSDLQIVYQS